MLPRSLKNAVACRLRGAFCVAAATVFSAGGPTVWAGETPAEAPLEKLIHAYFTEEDRGRRVDIQARVEQLPDVTAAKVAEAVGRVELWEPKEAGRSEFVFSTATGEQRTVAVYIPEGYAPKRAYPLLVHLRETAGTPMAEDFPPYVSSVLALAGVKSEEFLVAVPREWEGFAFHCEPREALEPGDLLHALRRRFHVDTDRVYLVAEQGAGGAAISSTMLYAHWFAGAVVHAGRPDVPYPRQLFGLTGPNLRHSRLLWLRSEAASGATATGPADPRRPADPFEALGAVADRLSLPVDVISLPPGVVRPPSPDEGPFSAAARVLRHRRDPDTKTISHGFRYPGQGRYGWLRQDRFDGEPWEAAVLAIVTSPATDFDNYATAVLAEKLAHIEGRIEGQRIALRSRRTDRIALHLHGGLINLAEPIEISWEGVGEYTIRVEPRVSTVLEAAHAEWDFKHIPTVRLRLDRIGRVRQY